MLRVLHVWQAGASGCQETGSVGACAAVLRQRFSGVPRLCAPPSPTALERAARTAALASPHCLNDTGAYMRAWRQLTAVCLHFSCAETLSRVVVSAGAFLALLPPLGFLLPPEVQAAFKDPSMKAAVALVRAHTHFLHAREGLSHGGCFERLAVLCCA